MKYLSLLVIIILFVLEFMIFPPLSAQIKHGSFTYQNEFENLCDSLSEQYILTDEKKEYPFTTIKEIRHNPDKYINEKVTITGWYQEHFDMEYSPYDTFYLSDNDYIICLTEEMELKPKLNSRGFHVCPQSHFLFQGDKITMKGKIIYDDTVLVLIEPHEILYDGLTWSIKQP